MAPGRASGRDEPVAAMSRDTPPDGVVDPRAVRVALASAGDGLDPLVLASAPAGIRLERRDATHAVLVQDESLEPSRAAVVMLPPEPSAGGTVRREVIVDGWRILVDIEPEQRASLRERARRGRDQTARTGRSELRAVIPGRILTVSIAPGDRVAAGQQVMSVEAMKMQNELRAPRDGVVVSVEVGPGRTVEVGDLLLVLE
jgi:biotin carboxyl carrier protein